MAETANPFADMFSKFTSSMQSFQPMSMPGFDLDALTKSSQANMEAFNEAGRIAVEGMQTLASRQQEMLSEVISELQDSAKDLASGGGSDMMSKPVEAARARFEKSVANLRELAEIAGKSQTEAWSVLGRRWQESIADFQKAAS